ncbi:fibulin-1-like [Cyprinus carpio]|uniref:Fibulin-1-like n=1 Tax=Cyprinus carpio TaxID=7962 RepID=A0A9Q9ZS05_CYPCA|nr:fibulin-1-like [Cyprinus carpio]
MTDIQLSQGDALNIEDQCKASGCSQSCFNGTCACLEGYNLKVDGKTCEDINECLLGSHQCGAGQHCINTLGSHRCQRVISCGTGFQLTHNNTCAGQTHSQPASSGIFCCLFVVPDIDECETGAHNCGAELECQNTAGSFRCRPRMLGAGFIQDALGSRIDVNECLSATRPCPAGHMCFNTVGSYTCQKHSVTCGRGYHLNPDGTRCMDTQTNHSHLLNMHSIELNNVPLYTTHNVSLRKPDLNECESSPCSQECANVYGSYQGYCRRGYQLSDEDGVTCADIDECALPTGGHICSYRCLNTPGSFQCLCPAAGYTLTPSGRSCQGQTQVTITIRTEINN